MGTDEGFQRSWPFSLLTFVIISLIALQGCASFRVFCFPERFPQFITRIRICDPQLWPFLSYPMYSAPHYLGERLDRPRIFAVLEGDKEVGIHHAELGLTTTQYIKLHNDLAESDEEDLAQTVADLYERNTQRRVIALRLAVHPTVFTPLGFVPEDIRFGRIFWMRRMEEGE